MMKWPPVKAWTSKSKRKGFNHFVAINYGGKSLERWVNLVSVLDGSTTLRISWIEMQDSAQWESGWSRSSYERTHPSKDISSCNHPSLDSGLTIPILSDDVRPWFDNE